MSPHHKPEIHDMDITINPPAPEAESLQQSKHEKSRHPSTENLATSTSASVAEPTFKPVTLTEEHLLSHQKDQVCVEPSDFHHALLSLCKEIHYPPGNHHGSYF